MQFNSYIYIFAFMPVVIIAFYLIAKASRKAADIFLLLASVLFYAYAGWQSLGIVIADALINMAIIGVIRKINKRKLLLILGVVINAAAILVLRITSGVLGISFISFQMIAIMVETYMESSDDGEETVYNCTFMDLMTYVFYFPKIVSGPIVSPKDFISKLHNDSRYKADSDSLASGFVLFTIGAFKKVMIADTFARTVNWGFDNFSSATSMDWVFVVIAYTFQIYFDFSGYCDMAGGVSRMLNLELPINFDSPYKALSVPDFWKRWHITLTDFLRKYIYFPLGGSRKGTVRACINIMIVFLVSGIWHGQSMTFVIWGLLHGLFSVIHRLISKWYDRLHEALRWMITFAIVSILWLLFRCESLGQWLGIIKKIVLIEDMNVSFDLTRSIYLVETETVLNALKLGFLNYRPIRAFVLFIIATFAVCLGTENAYKKKFKYGIPLMVFCVVLFVTVAISLGGETSFIYQRF